MNANILLCLRRNCYSLQKARWFGVSGLNTQRFLSSATENKKSINDDSKKLANKNDVWKSSKLRLENDREKMYRKLNLDFDLRDAVKEEVTIYELGDKPLYRVLFGFIVLQYIFWIYCANVLYEFYTTASSKVKPEEVEGKGITSVVGSILDKMPGFQSWVNLGFILMGNVFTVVLCYLMTRCVSFVRLMPGGKQAKIGTLTVFGGQKHNRYHLVNLSDLSCRVHRKELANYYNIRIRDRYFGFVLDGQGNFLDEKLYDHSIGVLRNIDKKFD